MRKVEITPGESYHIYNRGNQKQAIFLDARDYARFLFLLLHFQSPLPIYNVSLSIKHFMKHRKFNSTLVKKLLQRE